MTFLSLHQETLEWIPNFSMRLGIKHRLSMSLSQAYWVGICPLPPFLPGKVILPWGLVGSFSWLRNDFINPILVAQERSFCPLMRSKTPQFHQPHSPTFLMPGIDREFDHGTNGLGKESPHSERARVVPDYYSHFWFLFCNFQLGIPTRVEISSNSDWNAKYCNKAAGSCLGNVWTHSM